LFRIPEVLQISPWINLCDEQHDTRLDSYEKFETTDKGLLAVWTLGINVHRSSPRERIPARSSSHVGPLRCLGLVFWDKDQEAVAQQEGTTWRTIASEFLFNCHTLLYLWVDALWIGQDGDQGWGRKSAPMHTIYPNPQTIQVTTTIAAQEPSSRPMTVPQTSMNWTRHLATSVRADQIHLAP